MPRRAPSTLTAYALACLPLVCVAAACFALFGTEAATAAYFSLWRAEHPEATRLVRLFSDWGNPALYLVYAGFLARGWTKRSRGPMAFALAYLAAQLLVSLAIERVLKIAIGRPRPGVGGPFVPWSLDAAHNAMPSGHTVEMTVQTLPLAALGRGLRLLPPLGLGLLLALMGASRIALGAHHPSDVLAGLGLGLCGAALVPHLAPRIAARLPKSWSD